MWGNRTTWRRRVPAVAIMAAGLCGCRSAPPISLTHDPCPILAAPPAVAPQSTSAAPAALTLEYLLQIALTNHPDLVAAQARTDQLRGKLMQAGFHEVMDTEVMFVKWLRAFQDKRLLPPR